MVFDVHSLGRKRSTTARASASSSTLNEEATHANRLSQLHPPLIQAFFSCSNTANNAADEPARASMVENIAENDLDRQVLGRRPATSRFAAHPNRPEAHIFARFVQVPPRSDPRTIRRWVAPRTRSVADRAGFWTSAARPAES